MTRHWTTVSSRTVLSDRWIDVRADSCRTASGVPVEPYYVLSYPDWVHVVALTAEDEIVLVRQYRHAVAETVLEVPGGAVDASDADLAQAARRELVEETGFDADEFQAVSTLYPNPAIQTNRVHVFLARNARRCGEQRLDLGEEGMEALTIPVGDVVGRLADGLLGQSMHAAAVTMALMAAGRLKFVPDAG
ncbi:NUDIX hydrolase [Chelatococcus sambhunathii]|uniref:GDP-mannose pyrophosphatase n=1 Tax=Chelatococcus sambhunathii TaxID=363953 RepID=A0ABU1DD95_9HYPH|nr:NUDIX hydrolase [Chelatococcus sambhunathii]MDR4306071.1 NUDIX hydrolase [Chelatococcus sambhunathii]